jgi:hypothetical protein
MKSFIKISGVLLISLCCLQTAIAQTKNDKKTAKVAAISKMLNERDYIFKANFVNPQRGAGHALTSDYDLSVSKDSIIAYLPYFGRAYMADYGSTDGGIKFTWTHFDYKVTNSKNGGRDILIIPKDKNISDAKAVQSVRLNVSSDGYASLQVISVNRDPISFDGVVEEKRKPKGM